MAQVTLTDYLKVAGKSKNKGYYGLILDLLRLSDIMGEITFVDKPGLKVAGDRWQTLPATAFRNIGEGYTATRGTTEEWQETMYALGGDIQIDRLLALTKDAAENPLKTQMKMMAKSLAFSFNDYFINGDHATDPKGFEGLKKRVSNMGARARIYLDAAGNGTGAETHIWSSSENEHKFVDALNEAIYRTNATHLFMNENTLLKTSGTLRRLTNAFKTNADQYGRQIREWESDNGTVRLVDVGLKSDKSTEIITSTENPGDGGADTSSIYAARMDTDEGLHAIQLQGTTPEPYDPNDGAEMQTQPAYQRRIDWAVGLANPSQYCICRISGFELAAS